MRETATDLDDQLEDLEPPYESQAHRQIGRAFDQYGIPFFYRQATLVYEDGQHHVWHPDFTLPGYNGLVVEYANAAGNPNQRAYLQRRQAAYAVNQIPAVLVYPKDLSGSGWQERLIQRVAEAGMPPYRNDLASYSAALPQQPPATRVLPSHTGSGYR